MILLAIDPGPVESGWVLVWVENSDIKRVIDKGKLENGLVLNLIRTENFDEMAIEMIASYGMPVGKEVFETCVWIGRFHQCAIERVRGIRELHPTDVPMKIYRSEEKKVICGSPQAKDSNIRQALADYYAPGEKNYGKGTKEHPGFFYGFKSDIWQAFAVAHTYVQMYE